MKKAFLLFIFLFLSAFSFSQIHPDSLNRTNAKGKKYGLWKVYLTDFLITTEDTAEASYYAYDYYINGKLVIWTSSAQYYKKKAQIVERGLKPEPGRPQLLNGKFQFIYDYGVGLDEEYKDGLPLYNATCSPDSTGGFVRTELLDYRKQYNNEFGSFLYTTCKMDGTIIYQRYYTFDKKGRLHFKKVE